MQNLTLRTKLLAIAVPPLVILALLVAYALKVAFFDGELDGGEVQSDLGIFGLAGLAGFLASALVLILVTRSVTGPLGRLTQAADELSNVRLPALVELLRNPGNEGTLAPVELLSMGSNDELGRLASALDTVQVVAGEVTVAQRDVVKERVGVLVVNLARRNQTLLDRQLELIDQLETSERDPDRLEDLYRLDHLATRMRRNAESLLVLAGADPPRRRGAPVALVDVVRVAVGEIEDYRHVELGGVQDALVPSNVAVDLSHLLSELMENATQFSPPDAPVVVEGGRTGDGTYAVAIIDRGIGMNEPQLAEANARLDDPPELGLDLSRSLGFLVIARLAERLGVDVCLQPTPGGGTTATVTLPSSLLLESTPDRTPPEAEHGPTPVPAARGEQAVPLAPPRREPRPSPEPVHPAGPDTSGASAPATTVSAVPDDAATVLHPEVDPASSEDVPWEAQPAVAALFSLSPEPRPTADARPHQGAAPDAMSAEATGADGGGRHPSGERPAGSSVAPLPWFRHQVEISADPTRAGDPARSADAPPPGDVTHAAEAAPPAEPVPHPDATRSGATRAIPDSAPRRLAEAIPEGEAFEHGVAALLNPVAAPPPGDSAPSGLPRRRRGERAPTEQTGRPVAASGRSPEEIREMLARYRQGIKHRSPEPGAETQAHEPPPQEDDR